MTKVPQNINVVAIDGPAASGKSTVARQVARALGRIYVDSGALYRGVTWMALRRGVSTDDQAAVIRLAAALKPDFHVSEGAVRFLLDGDDPGEGIRSQVVNDNVSRVAALPEVRTWHGRLSRCPLEVLPGCVTRGTCSPADRGVART
jgi:cytidylate kinase